MTNGGPANANSVDEIIKERNAAREELAKLELELQEEIDEIRFKALQLRRPMSDEEKALRNERRATLGDARQAFQDLNFITLQRLDKSDEVQQLQQRLKQINAGIGDDLEQLRRIERYAATAAKIADAIAKTADKLAQVAARLSTGVG